ncbi:MAG TPA: dihydrodipicolinate synthase family protein [Kiloniellales bacterium]
MSITELDPRVKPESQAAYGIWAPAVTPLDRDLAPDPGRFTAHVRWLLDNGCHGVAVFGTTGEANSFAVDERIALLDATLEAGIPGERLMVGTGCCALTDTVRLTRHAVESGCKRVLMLPPFYYKGVSDEALYASYAAVIDRVGQDALAVYLYHFPRLSGVAITTGLVERLLASPYAGAVEGLKDSSGDPDSTGTFITRFPGLAVFPGTEALLLAGLEAGGAGCITASANVNAPAIRRVYDAWTAGSADAAGLQEIIGAQRAALQSQPLIPTLKRLIAAAHKDPAWLAIRPPLLPTDEAAAAKQDAALAAAGFAFGA